MQKDIWIFWRDGSREGLTGAELAGVEMADTLLVSRKVEYEDVWDLRNAGDVLERLHQEQTKDHIVYLRLLNQLM